MADKLHSNGPTLTRWRESAGISQTGLAKQLQISSSMVSLFESGDKFFSYLVGSKLNELSKGELELSVLVSGETISKLEIIPAEKQPKGAA